MAQNNVRPYKLESYRGDLRTDRDDALRSGPLAVKGFLEQFEGQEKLEASLGIAAAAGLMILEASGEADTGRAWPISPELGEAARGLCLASRVADISEREFGPRPS